MFSCKNVRTMFLFAGGGLLAAVFLTSPGCADLRSAKAFQSQAHQLGQLLEQNAQQQQAAVEKLPPDSPDRPQAQQAADLAQAQAHTIQAGIEQIDAILSQAEKPTDPITQSIQSASPLLPLPLRTPLLLGAAALVAGLRSWRLKTALTSVAKGFQTALREDKEFQACFAKHANTFRSTQTPTAKRIIDQTKAAAKPGILPI